MICYTLTFESKKVTYFITDLPPSTIDSFFIDWFDIRFGSKGYESGRPLLRKFNQEMAVWPNGKSALFYKTKRNKRGTGVCLYKAS